jgi:hypothetical protein
MGTRVVLAAAVGAAGDCAAADCAGDVALAEAGAAADEADELPLCWLHPVMRTTATAKTPPASNVRRALILVIFFNPLGNNGFRDRLTGLMRLLSARTPMLTTGRPF